MNLTSALLQRVEGYCRASDMTERAFGLAVVNDHKLISRMRAGYSLTSRTHDRITAFMEANPVVAPDAQPTRAPVPSPAGAGARISQALGAARMKPAELARRLNVSQPTVHGWVNDLHGITWANVLRVAAVLKVAPGWIMFGADEEAERVAQTSQELEARRLFAASLREARRRYGHETGQGELTQKEFAQVLGISGDRPEERYRLYEGGKREPPLWILAALRRVTGYSLDDIIAQLPAGRRVGQARQS